MCWLCCKTQGYCAHTVCWLCCKTPDYCSHVPGHFVLVSKAASQKFREDILESCLCPDFVQTCSERLNISCFLMLFNLQKQQTATKNLVWWCIIIIIIITSFEKENSVCYLQGHGEGLYNGSILLLLYLVH